MPTTNTNRPILDTKKWEFMSIAPAATATGATIGNSNHIENNVLYLTSNTTAWLYNPDQDGFVALSSPALAATFNAGASVCASGISTGTATAASLTATGGSASTIATNQAFARDMRGYLIHILSGPNAGVTLAIRSNTIGTNSTITVDTQASSFSASTVFRLIAPTFYVLGAGTLAAGSFKKYDLATNTWTTLSITGLPSLIGTDGVLVSTPSVFDANITSNATSSGATTLTDRKFNWIPNAFTGLTLRILNGTGAGQSRTISSNTSSVLTVSSAWTTNPDVTSVYTIEGSNYQPFAVGTATAGGASTLTNSARNWETNQWTNYQVRILSGTGAGQIRTIASNTATALTTSTAWTTTPDTTSVYSIEGNDDFLYFLGNNAVAMYRYSISSNTWTTLSPTAARGGSPSTGMSAIWVWDVSDPDWTTENAIRNGQRIYSFRGGAAATLDYYDIAANIWVNAVTYAPAAETFTTGSKWVYSGNFIYGHKDATGRWFRLNLITGKMEGWGSPILQTQTALAGNTAFAVVYNDGATRIIYIHMILNTSAIHLRQMVI